MQGLKYNKRDNDLEGGHHGSIKCILHQHEDYTYGKSPAEAGEAGKKSRHALSPPRS